MNEKIRTRIMGGTTYIRLPPAVCKHGLGLSEKEIAKRFTINLDWKEGSGRVTLEVEK